MSGLVAAYLLASKHEVRLFERNPYFGGHTHTVSLDTDAGRVQVDTGFIVYNEAAYPRFSRLLAKLGVASQPSDMSFSVGCRACGLAYSSRGFAGALAQPLGFCNRGGLRLAYDLWRFFRVSANDVAMPGIEKMTLSDYVAARRLGGDFRRHFLFPLAAAVWSMPPGRLDGFPAAFFLRFLRNHGLIGGAGALWHWRAVSGGSATYVRALVERIGGNALSDAPVHSVLRCEDGVRVCSAAGEERFDVAVIACHADEASAILADKSTEEAEGLGCFDYSTNHLVLHTDDSLLPARRALQSSWNYVARDCRDPAGRLSMTYHLNRLQGLNTQVNYCLSVNPGVPIRPDRVILELDCDHPAYSFRTLEAQRRVERLNGANRIFYAGAHLGNGFHEDGVASAYGVAAKLGVSDA